MNSQLKYYTFMCIVGTIIAIAVISNNVKNNAIKDAGRLSLQMQSTVRTEVFGNPIVATFEKGEYANISTIIYKGEVARRMTDLNGSRMVGNFLGTSIKELGKGAVDGLKKPSKHE